MRRRNQQRKQASIANCDEMWSSYKSLRNKVTGALRKAKCLFFVSLTSKSSKAGKRTGKQLNRLFTKCFSDHFAGGIANSKSTAPSTMMPRHSCTTSFTFEPISRDEVADALAKLDTKEASGMDDISAWMLKTTAPAIGDSLCNLFNFSLQLPQIPEEWKAAEIIPIPKTSKASAVENFCPISILLIAANGCESLAHAQVMGYLDRSCILHEAEFGFRPNHTTQGILLKSVEDWRCSPENNEMVGSVFIGLSKAFDSINHCLLLQNVSLYGF